MKQPPLRNALLEIGTEEIPARFIPDALQQLSDFLARGLNEAGVDCKNLEVWGTPRRLAAFIQGIPPRAKDRTDVAIGPPPKAAKDETGGWTPAALGFAKAQKTNVEKLIVQQTSKGERLVVVHAVKGQKSETVLRDLFPAAIRALKFPKTMVWEKDGFRFARPLRWIVALFNSHVIRFRVAGLQSDRTTLGLLALGGKKISISRAESYKNLLQGRCIMVDPETRSKTIRSQMDIHAKRLNARILVNPDNLLDVVHLTEYPVSLVGHFKEPFLKLPREVLVSALIKHQKFFPVETGKGQLSNAFIGVRNGPSDSQETVREGYQRVINARLSDAQFFFDHDSKLKLEDLASRLSGVGFLEKMGSLKEKMERVRKLTAQWSAKLNFSEHQTQTCDRIAHLAKADLLTQMVGEFPDLQGVAGRFYAAPQEGEAVAQGIEQHYWPLTAEGPLPVLLEASLVSVADKMDTLAAYFALGQGPTGSADPNGLRRLGAGVVRILLDRQWALTLDGLVHDTCRLLPVPAEAVAKAERDLKEFLTVRCSNWLSHQGFRADEIEAVFARNGESLITLFETLNGLKQVRARPEFEFLAAAIKRARNIIKQASERGWLPSAFQIQPEDLQTQTERDLYSELMAVRPVVEASLDKRDYTAAFLALATLKVPVDAFFEGVMVMVEDEKTRSQRLSLLMCVKTLFDSVADFSKLQGATSA